jgi:alpha 1,2-mannosyltransferase
LHYVFTHEAYGHSVANLLEQFGTGSSINRTAVGLTPPQEFVEEIEFDPQIIVPQSGQANAVILFLARNSDLEGVISSVRQLEDRFNRNYHYPWVFLNDEPFTEEFQRYSLPVRSLKLTLTYELGAFAFCPMRKWNLD